MTLFERLRRHAGTQPGRTALSWPGGELDYRVLLGQVEETMRRLRGLGVEVLAVDLDNGPAWVVLDIAALALGICLVPLPGFFSAGQLRHIVQTTAAGAVVSDNPSRLRERLGGLLHPGEARMGLAGRELTWLATKTVNGRPSHRVPAGVHKITFTSGTTGEPKGVLLSWEQMRPVVESLATAAEMEPDDRHIALMPLAVLLENIGGVYVPLWAGARVMLPPLREVGMIGSSRMTGSLMAAALAGMRATTAIFTPQTLQGVVEALEQGAVGRPGLRFAAVGGAPVSPRLLRRAVCVGLPVFEGYGLSEGCSVVCLNTPSGNRPGSVGRPLPHIGLRIADDGEVVVGGQAFRGYLGEPAQGGTEWPTGDLGELDADGFLYLRGRRRNLFVTAFGRNVAPEWVERELTLEPAIAQAAVFGEARACNVAVIVAADGASAADVEAALARANRALPDYARVSRWIAADAAFSPANGLLTGTGRVRRDAVHEIYGHAIESLDCEV